MRYLALATDYDGTLAHDGAVSARTIGSLEKLRQSGRKLLLVTGREVPELWEVFPPLDLFDLVVAENGALLYNPRSKEKRLLAEPPPPEFVENLRKRGVRDISTGAVIVAMWRPFEGQAIEAIRECGLDLQLIFNKSSVMVLPSGVNKMTGLSAALEDLNLSSQSVVAVGDAENDHPFLSGCGCAVAVANAIPSLKECADLVTNADNGDGVSELSERLLGNDLADVSTNLRLRG